MSARLTLALLLVLTTVGWARTPSSWGQPGDKAALTNATILVSPGKTLSKGTLLIEGGKVTAVGTDVVIPAGTRTHDLAGKVIHPGFLDPYVVESRVTQKEKTWEGSPQLPERVHDEMRLADNLELKPEAFADLRWLGFVGVGLVPERGIARGQAALYHTGRSERPALENLWQRELASVIVFEPLGWGKLDNENYPLSLQGNIAFVRQLFLDSAWYDRHTDSADPIELEATLASLKAVRDGQRMLFSEATSPLDVVRLSKLWRELGIPRRALILSGQEWRILDWLGQGSGASYILPIAFPKTPSTGPGRGRDSWTLDTLRDWHAAPGNPAWLAARGLPFSLTTHRLKSLDDWTANLQDAIAAGLSPNDALAALTVEPAKLLGVSARLGTLDPGKSASFVIRDGLPFDGKSKVEEVWIEGRRQARYDTLVEEPKDDDGQQKKGKKPEGKVITARPFIARKDYAKPPDLFPLEPFAPPAVLVRNATVWTVERGQTPGTADLLVRAGKIVAVGAGLSAPAGAHVIDGTGLHLTPGIIDAHSHTAIEGDVNEPGKNVTAMCAIKDVINPFDHDIYLQLASGVTAANLLHGSANAIGGQSITVKWRLGSPPEGMVLEGAPEGIKLALGENPKQSNWGDKHSIRYPQSRLGVNELIRGAFASAKNYRKQKEAGLDPEPDLALEALLEVLDGKRLIHCHSYRQDEILALIRLAEEEGFKVAVFQHVLEGYKVADELAAHGAGASTFADWWAYKVEVEDAIPSNAALMEERGVVASVNSDSSDLARRLNTEAGKSVRYGAMSEPEALALVTRNPAIQLGVIDRVGTLSPGKDADFVLWSAHPLSQQAVCLQTWVDGKRYYLHSDEARRVQDAQAERARLGELTRTKEEQK